jgi:arginyl-tRNA--protein-N-Asp/Glu arginylyltransferase
MKLVFSEFKSDYGNYIFPYAIWGFPESGETPADLFNQGFLPSSRELDRFYLCRNVRVVLPNMTLTSENRRVKRKGAGIACTLIPRAEFDFSTKRREFYKNYADIRFGKDIMTYERLNALFNSPITSHILLFTDTTTNAELGAVTLYIEGEMAYYYYSFYDLNYYSRNLGMYMMVTATEVIRKRGARYLYLGSCYSQNALYKTQFDGAEFFNGARWSANLDELKYLINREKKEVRQHLMETLEYRTMFYDGKLEPLVEASSFKVKIKA